MFYDYMNFIELTLTEDEFLLEKKNFKKFEKFFRNVWKCQFRIVEMHIIDFI